MARYEVHKDDTPCPENDDRPSTCHRVGAGVHEPIDEHLKRVHGLSADTIHGIRMASLVADVDTSDGTDRSIAVMFRVHDGIHLFF